MNPPCSGNEPCKRISSCGSRSSFRLCRVSSYSPTGGRGSSPLTRWVRTLELLSAMRRAVSDANPHRPPDAGLPSTYLMLANSLLMRFSSSSRALAFRRSAMNCTNPRMFELLLVDRPRKPLAVEAITEAILSRGPSGTERCRGRCPAATGVTVHQEESASAPLSPAPRRARSFPRPSRAASLSVGVEEVVDASRPRSRMPDGRPRVGGARLTVVLGNSCRRRGWAKCRWGVVPRIGSGRRSRLQLQGRGRKVLTSAASRA